VDPYAFFGSLAVASFSATVWFAYQHPRTYNRLANGASIVVMVAILLWNGFTVGYSHGSKDALAHAASGALAEDFDGSPFGLKGAGIGLAVMLVILALRYIHRLKDD
jgi:hypothetical protein